jgi:hypothetical protein
MSFAGLKFEYHRHRINRLPLSCCRSQRPILSTFRLTLHGFLRTLITLKRVLRKVSVRDLKPENQCVREKSHVYLFGCSSSDMQTLKKQQTVKQVSRVAQVCLTPKQGCAVQRWVSQRPSPVESGA